MWTAAGSTPAARSVSTSGLVAAFAGMYDGTSVQPSPVSSSTLNTPPSAPGAASRTKQQPNWKQAIRDLSGVMWAAVVPGVCLPARPSPGANMNLGSASKHAS